MHLNAHIHIYCIPIVLNTARWHSPQPTQMVPGFVSKSAWLLCQITQQAILQTHHARGRGRQKTTLTIKAPCLDWPLQHSSLPRQSTYFLPARFLAGQRCGVFLPAFLPVTLSTSSHRLELFLYILERWHLTLNTRPHVSFLWLSRIDSFPLLHLPP